MWQVLRTFNAFGERWRTGRRSLPADNRRRECGSLFDLNKPPCSGQPAPGEQLARRQPIPPRRRRHNPRRAVALRHDPLLLRQRPAPPGTCRNNLEPRDLRNRRMVSHTPMSSPSARITQGGARRSDTALCSLRELLIACESRLVSADGNIVTQEAQDGSAVTARTKDGAGLPAHSSDGTTPARSRSRRRTISGHDTGGAPSRAESDGAAPARGGRRSNAGGQR